MLKYNLLCYKYIISIINGILKTINVINENVIIF